MRSQLSAVPPNAFSSRIAISGDTAACPLITRESEWRARGLDVPGDVSITGFDDQELAANLDPPLTTVSVPAREMGRRAAEYLLARLEGAPVLEATELEATLVIRGTTAPPGGARPGA